MKNIHPITLIVALLLCTLQKTFAQGWMWGRGGTAVSSEAWCVATDTSGNVYGAGAKNSTATLSFGTYTVPAGTGVETFWVKYDNSGNVLWADGTVGGSIPYSITTDPMGNLIVFGLSSGPTLQIGAITLTRPAGFTNQFFLAKISPTGTVLWAVNDGNKVSGTGLIIIGAAVQGAGGVTTDTAGNIYIASSYFGPSMPIGTYTLTNSSSTNTYDIYAAKYTPSGTPVWASSLGGLGNDRAVGIAVTHPGYVYIAGPFWSPSMTVGSSTLSNAAGSTIVGKPAAYIAKLSVTGVPIWGEAGVSDISKSSFSVGLAKDNDDNVYMLGNFEDTTISFGTKTITQTYSPATLSKPALFLAKYSPADTITWHKTIGSPTQAVIGYGVANSSCGEVWVSARYSESVEIDGTIFPLVSGGGGVDRSFIAGYKLSGDFIDYSGIASGGDDQNAIACDGAGNIFFGGDYEGNPTFPFYIGPDTLTGSYFAAEWFFVAKYTNLRFLPNIPHISHDTSVCASMVMSITAPSGYTNYLWEDSTSSLSPTRTAGIGTYYVYDMNCNTVERVDTFHIHVAPKDSLFKYTDTTVCAYNVPVFLSATSGYTSYVWNTGDTTSSIPVSTGGYYISYANSVCSTIVDTFKLTLSEGNEYCYAAAVKNISSLKGNFAIFPNPFYPASSKLRIPKIENASLNYFSIYNSVGELVFKTKDITAEWNGSCNGQPQTTGIYIYCIDATTNTARSVHYCGSFNLIR